MKQGLDAPICLTWELTYACNLACVHCLSSSGQRDERELSTAQAKAVIDELRDLQVFYINIGGGEPMIRRDFFEIIEYSISNKIGVKFSTNGAFIDQRNAERLAATGLPNLCLRFAPCLEVLAIEVAHRRRLPRWPLCLWRSADRLGSRRWLQNSCSS
ncbi:MAG: hypothetical protein RI898_360 [Actinomycetota bacterium]